jgi:hypothetical protein
MTGDHIEDIIYVMGKSHLYLDEGNHVWCPERQRREVLAHGIVCKSKGPEEYFACFGCSMKIRDI